MASTPDMTTGKPAASNETAIAIIGSFIVAIVLSFILIGNPFTATRLAYTDYSKAPAAAKAPPAPKG
jgi:hypothetical protein